MDKVTSNLAANAYGKTMSMPVEKIATVGEDKGVSFSQFMEQSARQSLDTLKTGETMSARAVTGEADLTEVVQAVTAADLTLQTMVSIRDRMVSAFQEIMRMPI
jgi:flagellar hook-basal body complex protein FliE